MTLRNVGWILALASIGCGSHPDVVAVGSLGSESDAGAGGAGVLPSEPLEQDCEAGDYVGRFHGIIGLGPTFPLTGTIYFRLRAVVSGGEFLQITQSELSGETDAQHTITAEVESGSSSGCREGAFSAELKNGRFAGGFPFTGNVTGTYDASQSTFVGEWEVFTESGEQVGAGAWAAVLLPETIGGL